MMPDYAIETTHLRKEFGRKVAVADLTLQVKRGEVFGFLGPNGAGKTTSVKMLLGLTAPTAGDATLLNAPLGDRRTRARIGYLPEHFRFYPWLKAVEFLDLQGRLYGMETQRRRNVIPQLLQRVGLAQATELKLAAFSKGMTQRIGLAQALMNTPDLVFLDEPTSGLDPLGRRLVREIIAEVSATGTAVFLNSHLLSEVEQTCHRVAFIREGRVLETHDLSQWDEDAISVKMRVGRISAELLAHLQTLSADVYQTDDGFVHVTVSAEKDIPTLVNWLVAHNHALYELNLERLSLEDRFLKIIGNHSGDTLTA
ncbi:MAG: ABC transporter ATP-binding protein [Anaerolineae bacterium]|nr:ABC transporter ATP-binding protein [Anaerolineae bacterium]